MTVDVRDAQSFTSRLSKSGLSVQSIDLHGRFHHPVHAEAVQRIKDLCKRDKRFQLPTAQCLASPLRSNSDARLIKEGFLHETALESILLEQSQWFETVKATILAMGGKKPDIISVGNKGFVPRSVTAELHSEYTAPELSNGATGSDPEYNAPRIPSQALGSNTEPIAAELPNGSAQGPNMANQAFFHSLGQVQSEVDNVDAAVTGFPIAVVGMACRFPRADSLEQFWELISSGGCAIRQVPKDRFDTSELWRTPKGPFWGHFLREPDMFDHRFFNISGREAKSMDPQQRLLLQVAYEAIESSGHFGLLPARQPKEIGCYIGVGAVDYGDNIASQNASAFSATGTLRAFISGKVSHYFGWTGPSITFDTACSSSAVAIHSACKVSVKSPKHTQ